MRTLLLLGVLAAAALVAATQAFAVDQEPKNGCSSPVGYAGSLTSPPFATASGDSQVTFQGWFEIESIDPVSHDEIIVEYSLQDPSQGPRTWIEFGRLNPSASAGGAADQGYSNNGFAVSPSVVGFGPFVLPLTETASQTGVQVRVRFASGDGAFQGFRGVAVDAINITTGGFDPIQENFESGAGSWSFDPADPAGAPFWHIVDNSQNISVKSPEISPDLVTLPAGDTGALPATTDGTKFAWFGDDATGTYCGPDYANRIPAEEEPPPETTTTPTTPTTTAPAKRLTLPDLPVPDVGKEANVDVLAGTVLVGIPAGAARVNGQVSASQKGVVFVPLQQARQVPIGSFLDTRKGTVAVQTATGSANKTQKGNFSSGLFQVLQSRKKRAKGLTDLVLKGGRFNNCGARKRGRRAQAALTRRTVRRLRSNASGRFRTRGRFAAATVRGTKWTVTDRCDGTLTKVARGKVAVRDLRKRKTVLVRAGKSYLARAPR